MKPNAALLNRALELHRAGRLDDAAAIYQRLLTDNPDHADAAHLLGLVRFRSNDFDSAIRLIQSAVERDPDNPIYHANLCNDWVGRRKPKRVFVTGLRSTPTRPTRFTPSPSISSSKPASTKRSLPISARSHCGPISFRQWPPRFGWLKGFVTGPRPQPIPRQCFAVQPSSPKPRHPFR